MKILQVMGPNPRRWKAWLENPLTLTAFKNAPNPKFLQNLSRRLFLSVPVRGTKIRQKFVKICPKITVSNFDNFLTKPGQILGKFGFRAVYECCKGSEDSQSMATKGGMLFPYSWSFAGSHLTFFVYSPSGCTGKSINQERKISPKRKFLGRTSRGHPGVIRAHIPAQNFGQGGQTPGKTSISARTSMTRRRGRPRPKGTSKNFGQKNFGLNFRSLINCKQANFNFNCEKAAPTVSTYAKSDCT